MKIKCPRCQAALFYNIAEASMECQYCGSIFGMEDLKEPPQPEGEASFADVQEKAEPECPDADADVVNLKLFSCSSCGASLMVNETESATFCAYCGQPTLIEERISKQKKPKYILPFKIQKAEAERIVRERFAKGLFVPDSIKNFKLEKLNGVYIPYRMVDVYCQNEAVVEGTHGSGKYTSYSYHYRKACNLFKKLTVDASDMLNDESSIRLEPYHLEELVEFEPAYLSGFYANCMDTPEYRLDEIAMERGQAFLAKEMQKTIKSTKKTKIIKENPYSVVDSSVSIMLPAWFLSFEENGKNYTMMVNGQTGKMVGGVPYTIKRVAISLTIFTALFSPLMIWFMLFLKQGKENGTQMIVYLFMIGLFFVFNGHRRFQVLKKSSSLSCASDMKKFANERQEAE